MKQRCGNKLLLGLVAILFLLLVPMQVLAASATMSYLTFSDATVSGTTATMSASKPSGTSGTVTNTITITNSNTEHVILVDFDYETYYGGDRDKGSATMQTPVNGTVVSDTGSHATIQLQPSGYFKVTITSSDTLGSFGSSVTYFKMTNIVQSIVHNTTDVTVNYNGNLGTVKHGNTAIGAGSTVSDIAKGETLTATATNGTFLGWVDTNGKILTTSATYSVTPTATAMTVQAVFASESTTAWFWVDNTYLTNNLNTATSLGSSIILAGDGILPSGTYTIPSGDKLLLPYSYENIFRGAPKEWTLEDMSMTREGFPDPPEVNIVSAKVYSSTPTVEYCRLTMAEGAHITVNGSLEVSGQTHPLASGQWGNYALLQMESNTSITVGSTGTLYAYGFVRGNGTVTVESSGIVYEHYDVADYPPGGAGGLDPMNSAGVFGMTNYTFNNVEVSTTYKAGAKLRAYLVMTGYNIGTNAFIRNFIGSDADAVFNLKSGTITKTYSGGRQNFVIAGNTEFNKLYININALVVNYTVDSSQTSGLPISHNWDITIKDGAAATLNGSVLMYAGSTLTIEDGGKLVIPSGIKFSLLDPESDPSGVTGNSVLDVNGEIQVDGGFYNSYSGASMPVIKSSGGTGKVTVNAVGTETTFNVRASGDNYAAVNVTPAKLQNEYTNNGALSAQTATDSTGTYNYNAVHKRWVKGGHVVTDVVTPPNCQAEGYTTHTCTCGYVSVDSQTEMIPCADTNPLDGICDMCGANLCAHTKKVAIGEASEATCTDPGMTAGEKCADCGTVLVEQEEVEANGHNPGAAATCTTNQICTVCNAEVTAVLGHDMITDAAVAATCTETGLTEGYHCSRCDDATTAQEEVPALGHDYAAVVTAPTCENKGYTTHTCANCSDSYVDSYVDALGHTWDDGTVTTVPTCSATGVKTFNCTVDGCNGIKTETVDKDPNNHKLVTDAAVAATCTETGLTEGKHCEYCGTVTVTQTEVPALGHTEVVDAASAPTCTETGLTQGSHCSVCSEVLVAQTEVAAQGHAYGDGVITTAPTCTENGVRSFTCGTCGDSNTETVAATGHSAVEVPAVAATCEATGLTAGTKCQTCGATITAQQTVAALGHNFANYTSNNDATCISDGTKTATCTRCDATNTVADVDSMLGHDFQNYTSDNNATCAADGTKTAKCTRCDATDTIDDEGSQTTVHTWGAYVSNNDATCTKDGTETATCTVCKTATDTRTDEGSKLDHTYSSVVTAPTCTASGYTTYTCSCGDTYTSDEVAALGHTEVTQEAVAATCTESGLTAGKYCSVCNAVLVAQETIPALGHSYSGAVTPPTCTEDGYTTYACSGCGDSYVDDHTEATGHSYNEVVTAPTCTEAGYTTYTCSACGDSYVADEVAAKGHDYNAVVTAPTCTAEGFTTYTCACGDSYVADKGSATGHSYGEWVQTTAPTCTEDGEKTRTCACGDQETETVAALGHIDGDPVVENKVDATCGTSGSYDTVVYCSVCKAEVSRVTTTVDALGHSYSSNVTTEPTCTEAGVKTFTCGTCGDTYTEAVAALGHDEVSHEAQAPTCIDIGWDAYVTCKRCDYTTKVELPVIAHSDSAEDTDHICDTEGCDKVMNDCSDAEGDENHSCDICGAENISAHSWNDATCTAPKTCSECGATEGTSNDHSYTTSTVAPTCTTSGYTTHTCSGCGTSYTETIAATGHVNTTTATVDATCVADGSVTVTCNDCDAIISTETIAATGEHTYGEDGKCTVCGAEEPAEPFEIDFVSMVLQNSLTMRFAFPADSVDDWTGAYAEATKTYADGRSNVTQRVAFSEWNTATINGILHYHFPFDMIAGKEMSDRIYVTVYNADGEAISEEYVESVRTYAMRTLNDSSNVELNTLIVDLLNYGAAAQTYFGYATDDLANNQLSEIQKDYASTTLVECIDTRIKGTNYQGSRLMLEESINLQMAFSGLTLDMTATIEFTDHYGRAQKYTVAPVKMEASGAIVISIDQIVVADARHDITVTVFNVDGTVYGSATDSIASYVARLTSDTGALNEMIMKFSDSAYSYLH